MTGRSPQQEAVSRFLLETSTLGRLFNVLGDTVDGGENLDDAEHWVIHRDPPSFEDQKPAVEILETGIKVIDLLAPYAKGGKIGLFGGAGVGKTVLIQELIQNVCYRTWRIFYFHRCWRAFPRR